MTDTGFAVGRRWGADGVASVGGFVVAGPVVGRYFRAFCRAVSRWVCKPREGVSDLL